MTTTGAMRIAAVLGRVGVCVYRPGGGVVRRELRPPDEVFRADSMETLGGAVVTDQHPPLERDPKTGTPEAWITPSNWKKWAVGYVADNVRQDGDRVLGTVTVQDEAMIQLIREGKRREISPGYMCLKLDQTPGRWNGKEYGPHVTDGEPYDCIQRDIVYNTVGLGPRGWGRQGSDVALRLDASDQQSALLRCDGTLLGDFIRTKMLERGLTVIELAEKTGIIVPKPPEEDPLLRTGSVMNRTWVLESILDGWTDRPSDEQLKALARVLDVDIDTLIRLLPLELRNLDSHTTDPETHRMDDIELRLDGLTVKVPKSSAEIVQKAITERDAKIVELTKSSSSIQARLDGLTEQHDKTKAELVALPGKLRADIEARSSLETRARKVLGESFKLDGLTQRQVQEAALVKLSPELKLDGKDDTYVAVRFDMALESVSAPSATDLARQAALGGPNPKLRTDSADDPDPAAARAEMMKRNQDAWKGPAAKN